MVHEQTGFDLDNNNQLKEDARSSDIAVSLPCIMIRKTTWRALKIVYTATSGENEGESMTIEGAKTATRAEEIKVSINGSLEIMILTKTNIVLLPWTCVNNFTLVRHTITGTATLNSIPNNFHMVVYWDEINTDLMMCDFIVDHYSGTVLGVATTLLSKNDVVVKSRELKVNVGVRSTHQYYVTKNMKPHYVDIMAFEVPDQVPDQVEVLDLNRIEIVRDTGCGPYRSLLVVGSVEEIEGDNNFVLNGYVDVPMDMLITAEIRRLINARRTQCNVYAWTHSGTIIHFRDAEKVVPIQMTDDKWLNDNIMYGYLELLRRVDQTTQSNIHLHSEFTSVNLYMAYSLGGVTQLGEEALKLATQMINLHAMSRCYLSTMLINLYNDHWYVLVIYPQNLKRIDCLNWLQTDVGDVRMICRLLHSYLWAHAMVDTDFEFDAKDWSFCVIKPSRVPQQTNGYDCGVFTLRCLEYLIAGAPMTFTEDTMMDYRHKILAALRLKTIPWLLPTEAIDIDSIITTIRAPVPRSNNDPRDNDASLIRDEEYKQAKEVRTELTNIINQHGAVLNWDNMY